MHIIKEDTPPSSVHDDEIFSLEDDEMFFEDGDVDHMMYDDDIEIFPENHNNDMEIPIHNATLVFDKHVGSVFCCDLHPSGKVAATGGEDDKAYVWSAESGQVLMECLGHKDSVIFVGFCFDGSLLATIDMGGLIKVWKCNLENQQPWPVTFEYECGDLNWGLWHNKAKVLMCGGVSGEIFVLKIPSGETKVLQGHNAKSECGKLFPDGLKLAAGYEDGSVKVWDLKTGNAVYQLPRGAHPIRVTAVDVHKDNNLVASISTDGTINLSTASSGNVVGSLEVESELETVAFAEDPEFPYFAVATLNGSVTIWDNARQMRRHHCALADLSNSYGVTKMFWVNTHLVTGCLEGNIRIYDGRAGIPCLGFTGHRSDILDMCYNDNEKIILSASDDGTARIFKFDVSKED